MARERMITRTIKNTTLTVLKADTTTGLVTPVKVNFGGGYVDNETAIKEVQKKNTATTFFLSITEVQTTEEIWGMTEDEFMKHARRLDKR